MIRLTLIQFRAQAWVALGLLAAVAVVLGLTGPHLAHVYDLYQRAEAACAASPSCGGVDAKIGQLDKLLELIGTALVAVPGLIGAFWGAPLITREFENGTYRLAWTQSVTRTRWLTVKLLLVGLASVVATGLLSLMVTWWSSPIDQSSDNRFNAGLFGERNIAPLGYAAFGFAIGVLAGVVIRRTLPAMAATLAVFLGVRLGFTYGVRSHLMSPVHAKLPLDPRGIGVSVSNGGKATLSPAGPNLPGAWVYSNQIVDGHGRGLTSSVLAHSCPQLSQVPPPPGGGSRDTTAVVPASVSDGVNRCVTKLSATYHQAVSYQPASRYWPFQWIEMSIFLAAAAALGALCVYWVRRRVV